MYTDEILEVLDRYSLNPNKPLKKLMRDIDDMISEDGLNREYQLNPVGKELQALYNELKKYL